MPYKKNKKKCLLMCHELLSIYIYYKLFVKYGNFHFDCASLQATRNGLRMGDLLGDFTVFENRYKTQFNQTFELKVRNECMAEIQTIIWGFEPLHKRASILRHDKTLLLSLTHSHTMTPFYAPGKQAV